MNNHIREVTPEIEAAAKGITQICCDREIMRQELISEGVPFALRSDQLHIFDSMALEAFGAVGTVMATRIDFDDGGYVEQSVAKTGDISGWSNSVDLAATSFMAAVAVKLWAGKVMDRIYWISDQGVTKPDINRTEAR
jgi:hypothetical protein